MAPKSDTEKSPFIDDAIHVLETGDPVKYVLDTFSSIHKGDSETATVLLISIATQSILNSDGIHPNLSGESGKGKSHACRTMLHLIPKEYWVSTSLSGKVVFYADIKPGTIIFSDDATIGEELEATIKRATSDFQFETTHWTVSKQRKAIELMMAPRISWWLSSVDTEVGEQTINRQFGVTVDESKTMDDEVKKFQLEKAVDGSLKFPVTDDVLISREIMRIIKETTEVVTIPFAKNIKWDGGSNRRNLPIFLDIIRAFALFRAKQRPIDSDGKIEATIDDYNSAYVLYNHRAETQTTKLNDTELKIVHILESTGEMDTPTLQSAMNLSQARIHQILHGRSGSGGLLAKVPELECEKVAVKVDNRTTQKNIYSVNGFKMLESFDGVVSINEKEMKTTASAMVVARVKTMMDNHSGSHRYYNTHRGFALITASLEDEGIERETITAAIKEYKLSKVEQ